ncbi:hypothetical protein FIBSPDRAFT_952822 [Athelia psychrophila]|uniref:Uncharacterized protein n=1 Tax=Athelia psychrophila TaxID=1759441 RepID=A0A166L0D7_9AGAM|nr:hypothetical protein FIBSPDRAFT_952822 [Fibularhizoctonia sp. CBS 109695]
MKVIRLKVIRNTRTHTSTDSSSRNITPPSTWGLRGVASVNRAHPHIPFLVFKTIFPIPIPISIPIPIPKTRSPKPQSLPSSSMPPPSHHYHYPYPWCPSPSPSSPSVSHRITMRSIRHASAEERQRTSCR